MTHQRNNVLFIIKIINNMANSLTITQKVEALENALRHYNFNPKFIVQSVNGGRNAKFAIAQKNELGGVDCHTNFMTYEEFNAFCRGYFKATVSPFEGCFE